jgi:hypothetical protein
LDKVLILTELRLKLLVLFHQLALQKLLSLGHVALLLPGLLLALPDAEIRALLRKPARFLCHLPHTLLGLLLGLFLKSRSHLDSLLLPRYHLNVVRPRLVVSVLGLGLYDRISVLPLAALLLRLDERLFNNTGLT